MKIAILAGSNRKQATSTQLCRYIGSVLETKECEVTLLDLNELQIPFYSPDIESDNKNLQYMKETLKAADGIVLATPEYHGAPSGVLKNALDHVGFDHFDGKVVLSVSSSGGAVGISSLQQLQTIVRNVHGINCPEWISISGEQRTFTADGAPADQKTKDRAERTLNYFVGMVKTFRK
ncbi:NAD(P)H-dependent oxidoreductase [Paenibacillus doosanensis]|uniref:FMN-dependent NADPH-azoreductase n=1 Tax=Paenibacillus konkukensis TaxID=2020716 RepID=A0ABY4RK25_9BACL|nr:MULTISPECIES: NADPH-dependent FMN reductase [Paenibacillus]MCS7460163.1 NAD(P)H-dependent oxidoreductase [Paenibacillus doosanensis]UQZ82821.1 FMN-dependent NADPH-azoreductase [Paenibacillus konkukensis]